MEPEVNKTVTHDLGCGWLVALMIVCFTVLAIMDKVIFK